MRSFKHCQKFIAFTLEFKQESESKTLKWFGVGVYSAEAGVESESKLSDYVHLWCVLETTVRVRSLNLALDFHHFTSKAFAGYNFQGEDA